MSFLRKHIQKLYKPALPLSEETAIDSEGWYLGPFPCSLLRGETEEEEKEDEGLIYVPSEFPLESPGTHFLSRPLPADTDALAANLIVRMRLTAVLMISVHWPGSRAETEEVVGRFKGDLEALWRMKKWEMILMFGKEAGDVVSEAVTIEKHFCEEKKRRDGGGDLMAGKEKADV